MGIVLGSSSLCRDIHRGKSVYITGKLPLTSGTLTLQTHLLNRNHATSSAVLPQELPFAITVRFVADTTSSSKWLTHLRRRASRSCGHLTLEHDQSNATDRAHHAFNAPKAVWYVLNDIRVYLVATLHAASLSVVYKAPRINTLRPSFILSFPVHDHNFELAETSPNR